MAPHTYEALIAGETKGVPASVLRAGLRGLSAVYGSVVHARNRMFDTGLRRVHRMDVPIISVGNITTGGTGKTPLVLWLCEHLIAQGHRVAVLARGYGADRGRPNDELRLISRRCPEVVCIAEPDRVAAARTAIERHGADVILLDDGFQHRRIGRDLDIVLVDATCPFGYGHLLPRGLLRESTTALRRAGIVILTHTESTDEGERVTLERCVRQCTPAARILACRHRPTGFVDLAGKPAEPPEARGTRIACMCSIARPESFERTVREMGYEPVACRAWPDHYVYTARDIADLRVWADTLSVHVILTTEKDAVKLSSPELSATGWPCSVLAVRVAIGFESSDDTRLAAHVDDLLQGVTPRTSGAGREAKGSFHQS